MYIISSFTLGQGHTQNVTQYLLQHMTNAPAKFKVTMSKGLGGNAFTRNICFDLDFGSKSHEELPSTSRDMYTCKV